MGYSYSCVPSALAFEVMWGWRQPCFVTNLTAIYLLIVLFSYEQAREQAHLQVKTGRFVFVKKKKTTSLPASPPSKGQGTQRETVKWSSEFFTPSGSEEYHPQKLRIFRKRSQNWQNDFENADLSNLTLSLQTFDKKLRPHLLKEANSKELEKKRAFICTSHLLVHGSTFSETDSRTTFGEITSFILRTKFKKSSKITLYLTAKKMG